MFHGSDTILAGDFSASGSVAATGGKGRLVSLWDTDGGDKIMSMPGFRVHLFFLFPYSLNFLLKPFCFYQFNESKSQIFLPSSFTTSVTNIEMF